VNEHSSLPVRLVRGFARFWWDFLVGDTPEIFVAVLIIIGVIALVSERGHLNAVAIVVLPVLAVLTLFTSLWRATRASRRK
jgi:hypothetical protein